MQIKQSDQRGFTLYELLAVMGIIIVLFLVVVYVLNPANLIRQGQDGNRAASIGTLNKAISLYYSDAMTNPKTLYMGSSSIIYISIPDPTATTTAGTSCAGLGLTSYGNDTYHCAASSTYQKTDGTGWLPIDLNNYSGGNTISNLPIDPINTTSSGEYYIYVTNGTSYELLANPASAKDASSSDFTQGSNTSLITGFPGTVNQNIWIADYTNNTVQEFNASGTYLGQMGQAGIGNGDWNNPTALAFDTNGNMYITTKYGSLHGSNEIQEMNSGGTYVNTFYPAACSGGNYPSAVGIAIDSSGDLYSPNYSAAASHGIGQPAAYSCVTEMSSTGTAIAQIGTSGTSTGEFENALGIAMDGSGNIWATDGTNAKVLEFSSAGSYLGGFGVKGTSAGQLESPSGITIAGNGNVWVTDTTNHDVQEFTTGGSYVTALGSVGTGAGQFESPNAIAIDANGNIWVVDGSNEKVEEFSSGATYINQFGTTGTSTGQFEQPDAIAIH